MSDRNRALARIHCARKELGLDEDTYRDMLEQITGVRSAKDLDARGLMKVLDHLTRLGAKMPARPHNIQQRPRLAKIEALLAEEKRPLAYANSIAMRMFKVHRVEWCDEDQLAAIITALIVDRKRRAQRDTDATVASLTTEPEAGDAK